MVSSLQGTATQATFSWRFRQWVGQLFGLDLRSLALFRVGMATLLLADLVLRSRDLVGHYTDAGVLPRWMPAYQPSHLTLHLLNGSAAFMATMFVIAAFFAILMLIGCWTRLSTIVSWFLLCSVQARNPLTADGAQDLLRLLMFWAMFLPLSARYSVDSALRLHPLRRRRRVVTVATVALMLQVLFVYWFSYRFKNSAEWRDDGSATYYALSIDMLSTPIGQWLLNFPTLLRGLTYAIIGLEAFGPVLFFFPWRNWLVRCALIALFWGVHIGFILCMWIELFPFICIVAWATFIPSEIWDAWAARLAVAKRRGLAIYYSGHSRLWRGAARLARTFLILPQLKARPLESLPDEVDFNDGWLLTDAADARYRGFDAALELARLSPIFWPVAWVFSWAWMRAFGRWCFKLAVRMRSAIDRVLAALAAAGRAWREHRPVRIAPWAVSLFTQTLASVCLVYVIGYNLLTMDSPIQVGTYYPLIITNGSDWDVDVYYVRLLTIDKSNVTFHLGEQPRKWHFAGWMHAGPNLPLEAGGTRYNWKLTFHNLGRELRLDQRWSMFAPTVLKRDGWFVMSARLADGSNVDLWTGKPVTWEKPSQVAFKFPNYRWFKLMEKFLEPNANKQHHPRLCQWLCRQWNDRHPASRRVLSLEIYFVVEFSQPPYVQRSRRPENNRVRITSCTPEPSKPTTAH